MKPLTEIARLAIFAFFLASLGGCEVVKKPTLLGSPEYRAALPSGKYAIIPGDQLEIRFFHTPEHNVTLPVRPDGYISLPYLGDVLASGKTAEALAREITTDYGQTLRNPQITVIVRSFSSHQVHVGGRVNKPGVFPLAGPMTVLDSLYAAGGAEPQARLSQVVIIRRAPDSRYLVIPINIEAVLDGTNPDQNIRLLPYDAIYVPNSPIANVNKWVDLYIRQNIPINFGIAIRPDIWF